MNNRMAMLIMGSGLIATGAQADSAVGEGDPQDFYRPFSASDIPVAKMQEWPYYKHTSAHWDEFVLTSTARIDAAQTPAILVNGRELDLNTEFRNGQSYIDNLIGTQTKGFVVLRGNDILAEFYDNGYSLHDTNLLQSASKTYAGVITHMLAEDGLLSLDARIDSILADFAGSTLGAATVQQVLDMTSGVAPLSDYHTPGTPGQLWEIEIGLQPGEATGHVAAMKAATKTAEPGEKWQYTDVNTDTLALLAEMATGKPFADLLGRLANDIGAVDASSIVLTKDGTASPAYGISVSARDYALFHRWLAGGGAPESFYDSALDPTKDLIGREGLGEVFAASGHDVTYGSQTYFIAADNVIFSFGSFGQLAFSDMEAGVVVVNQQDWVANGEVDKLADTIDRSLFIIRALRQTIVLP